MLFGIVNHESYNFALSERFLMLVTSAAMWHTLHKHLYYTIDIVYVNNVLHPFIFIVY